MSGALSPIETRSTYSVAEAAQLLGISRGAAYALVRTGDIPALRMGGRWIIPKRRFHAWLDDPTPAAAAAPRLDHVPPQVRR